LETKDNLISNSRLFSQKISASEFKTAKEIVSWMAAVQAQDFSMAKWAIGVRLAGNPSDKRIETAINNGEIIRMHALRPTWHFISADDVYWLLGLSASKIISSLKSRHKQLGLNESIITKTRNILEDKLLNGRSLTRDELANEFTMARIRTDENRLSHILFRAEMDGVVCSGPVKNNRQTYSLLYERVPHKNELSRDEALAELAERYFKSRCPATFEDFIWWSNLSVSDARKAIDSIKSDFTQEITGGRKYWIPRSFSEKEPEGLNVYLLPAFDEFLISYRDRNCSLSFIDNKKTVSDNGIFHPAIVVNGQVAGLWKRTMKKNKVITEINLFQKPGMPVRKQIEKKAFLFGQFLEMEIEIIQKIKS
jgi:Winged helix DNA-binding domain